MRGDEDGGRVTTSPDAAAPLPPLPARVTSATRGRPAPDDPPGWSVLPVAVLAAATCAAVLVALGVPAWRSPMLQGVLVLGVLVLAVVQVVRLPARSPVGWGVLGVLCAGGAAAALVVVGGGASGLSRALVVVAQLVGVLVVLPFLARRRRDRPRAHPWSELAVVVVGTALGVAQVVVAARRSPELRADVLLSASLALDVVVLSALLWLLLQRRAPLPSAAMLLVGGMLFTGLDLASAFSSSTLGSPDDLLQIGWLVTVPLLVGAVLHPSLRSLHGSRDGSPLRSGAARLAAVAPWGVAPAVSWAVGADDPVARLPQGVVVGAGTAVFVLVLVRARGLLAEADRRAGTDPLTGHLGRLGLEGVVADRHRARAGGHLALLDLDGFKVVNDTLGHQAGDQLLRAATGRFVRALPAGTAIGRLGGDELVVLVPRGGHLDPAATGRALLELFEDPFAVGGGQVSIAASIGVVDLASAPSPDEALSWADIAMYAAKRRGGGRWAVWEPALREEVLGRAELTEELRRLLTETPAQARDAEHQVGELVVLYQPVVDLGAPGCGAAPGGGAAPGAPARGAGLQGAAPLGVEALVRWRHPRRGLLGPAAFLPLAEAADLGAALDRAVLVAATRQAVAWDAAGLEGLRHVGVNLGAGSMRSPTLRADVEAACAAAGLSPRRVLLEITEHEELEPTPEVLAQLQALRAQGVVVALDDFGAGYASLGYLRLWPVDLVKLDRSLLPSAQDPAAHPQGVEVDLLLPAAAVLVQGLQLAVLAEGVETPADVVAVRAAGVERVQGDLVAPPLTPVELARWWRAAVRRAGSAAAPDRTG